MDSTGQQEAALRQGRLSSPWMLVASSHEIRELYGRPSMATSRKRLQDGIG